MISKKPRHCDNCVHWHKANHPKGSNLRGTKFDNWCCKYSTEATKAQSICKLQFGKKEKAE